MGQDRAHRIVCASHSYMVDFLAYRYRIFPHTWRAPGRGHHSPYTDSLARNFHLDFPGSNALVPGLDRCHICAEGEEKALIRI